MKKNLFKALSILIALSLLVGSFQLALADQANDFHTFTQTYNGTSPEPASGEVDPRSFDGDGTGWMWPNIPIGEFAVDDTEEDGVGLYRVMSNYWNPAALGADGGTGTFAMQVNDKTGEFWLTDWEADAHFSGQNQAGCTPGTDEFDPTCEWAGVGDFDENLYSPLHQNHAPSVFPSIYKGCHWGQCTSNYGAPFPAPLTAVASLKSTWHFTVPSTGIYDAAYDIWLDQSEEDGTQTQPNGAEIMIWLNHNGYPGTINPAGTQVGWNETVAGIPGTWDIWAGRLKSDNPGVALGHQVWNVISYVRVEKVVEINDFESTNFVDDILARNLSCAGTANDFMTPEEAAAVPCISTAWWISSVQAGYEIWEANPATIEEFSSLTFSVDPVVVSGPRTGNRPPLEDGTPLVHWDDVFEVSSTGCANGTNATYQIVSTNGGSVSGDLEETPPGSGVYIGEAGPLHQVHPPAEGMHDGATVTVSMTCGDQTVTRTGNIYIDPSGTVRNLAGDPVEGATVRLYRSTSGAPGTFTLVPNGDASVMDPAINTSNPSLTNQYGFYRWDVVPGYYRVRAEKSGCGVPVFSQVLHVTSVPFTDIDIVLACGTPPPSNDVTVVLTPMSDWGTGYCRNVIVTNNTDNPIDWKVTFQTPGQIYDFWNVVWSQSGTTVTAEGVGWNNILPPHTSSHSIGFCANR